MKKLINFGVAAGYVECKAARQEKARQLLKELFTKIEKLFEGFHDKTELPEEAKKYEFSVEYIDPCGTGVREILGYTTTGGDKEAGYYSAGYSYTPVCLDLTYLGKSLACKDFSIDVPIIDSNHSGLVPNWKEINDYRCRLTVIEVIKGMKEIDATIAESMILDWKEGEESPILVAFLEGCYGERSLVAKISPKEFSPVSNKYEGFDLVLEDFVNDPFVHQVVDMKVQSLFGEFNSKTQEALKAFAQRQVDLLFQLFDEAQETEQN